MRFNTIVLITLAALALLPSAANAAAVEWYFWGYENDELTVFVTVYGDDNRGLATYDIEVVNGSNVFPIDPNTISWSESIGLSSPPHTGVVGPVFFSANSQTEDPDPQFDIGLGSRTKIGVLTTPPPHGRAVGTATLFTLEAPNLPTSELGARTLPPNRVSIASHGGYLLAEDWGMRTVPRSGTTIDFGEVPLGTTIFQDIVALINGGFDGRILDVTEFEITGKDADLFDVPDFSPSSLIWDESPANAKTYDLSFAPTRLGSFESKLTFSYETRVFSGIVRYSLIGVAVPEPLTIALLAVGTLAFLGKRRRSRLYLPNRPAMGGLGSGGNQSPAA